MLLPSADTARKVLCEDKLTAGSVAEFKRAIKEHYWYELFMDDLPVWGFVGEYLSAETSRAEGGPNEEQVYIYTHKSFDINYNGNRVRIPATISVCGHGHRLTTHAALHTDHPSESHI